MIRQLPKETYLMTERERLAEIANLNRQAYKLANYELAFGGFVIGFSLGIIILATIAIIG